MQAVKKSGAHKPSLVQQGVKFVAVGASNSAIDYTIYILVSTLFHVPLSRLFVVKLFSGSAALINSFYWNRRWTFQSHASVGRSGWKFIATSLVSVYVLQPIMVWLAAGTPWGHHGSSEIFAGLQTMGITGLAPHILTPAWVVRTLAFVLSIAASGVWDFTLYKLWAFKDSRP